MEDPEPTLTSGFFLVPVCGQDGGEVSYELITVGFSRVPRRVGQTEEVLEGMLYCTLIITSLAEQEARSATYYKEKLMGAIIRKQETN